MDANIFSKLPGVLYEFFQYFQCLHGTRYARQSIIVLWFALYYGYVRQLPCLNTSHHFFIKCCGIFSLLFVPFSACYLYHFQLVICTPCSSALERKYCVLTGVTCSVILTTFIGMTLYFFLLTFQCLFTCLSVFLYFLYFHSQFSVSLIFKY